MTSPPINAGSRASRSGWIERLYGYDLFISYTRRDDPESGFARALQSALTTGSRERKRKPMRCFLDWRDMPHDDELRRAVEEKIAASHALLLVAGQQAKDHDWMCFEAGVARRLGRRILVVDRGIGWATSIGPLKQTVGDVLAMPSDPALALPDEALLERISVAVGTRRQAAVRRRLWLTGMLLAVLALLAAFWSRREADESRRETVRSEAAALYQRALGRIPRDEVTRVALEKNEVLSDEPTRDAMALLAQTLRLDSAHRPAAAALAHLVHQRPWPVPIFAAPHAGVLSNASPRFAGAGRWLITYPPGSEPARLVVWNMESEGDPLEISMDAGEELQCFTAAKFGTSLFIGTRQNKVYVYDLEKQAVKDEVTLSDIPLWLACSDDGLRLAIGGHDGSVRLRVYTGDEVSEAEAKVESAVRSLAMDDSGDWLAASSDSGKLWVWKCGPDGLDPIAIEASVPAATSLAFHGNPPVLAAGSPTGVQVFDLQTASRVGADTGFDARSFFTSPLGGFLVWGREKPAFDNGAMPDLAAALHGVPVLKGLRQAGGAWEIHAFARYPIPALDNPMGIVEVGTSGAASLRLQVCAAGNHAYLTTMDSLLRRELRPEIIRMPAAIHAAVPTPAGETLLLADAQDAVLWQPGAPPPRPWLIHTPAIYAAALSPDGHRLAVVQAGGELKIWSCAAGRLLFTRQLSGGKEWKLDWSTDGKFIAATLENKFSFKISAEGTGELVRRVVPPDWLHGPVLLEAASRAAGITRAGKLGVWDLDAARWLYPPITGFGKATAIAATADAKIFAVVVVEGETRYLQGFSTADGRATGVRLPIGEDAEFALSARGTYAAIQQVDGFAICRVADGTSVWSSAGQQTRVVKITFSPDEKRFAAEALDLRSYAANCQFWQLPSARPSGAPVATPAMTHGQFSADGQFFCARSPATWEILDPAQGVRIAQFRDDIVLAGELGGDIAGLISTTDSGGRWRATQMGDWLALAPMLPDFASWNADDAGRLAHLAECLAQKNASAGGGLQNIAPRETIGAVERLTTALESDMAKTGVASWSARSVGWHLLGTPSQKLSPWVDLDSTAWVDQVMASKDPKAIRLIQLLGPLSDEVGKKLEVLESSERGESSQRTPSAPP